MIVTDGLEDAVDALTSRWTKGESGTDNTLPALTQTDLIASVGATNIDLNITISGTSFRTSQFVSSATATGTEFFEWAIKKSDGTLISRAVTAGTSHDANDSLTKLTTFNVLNK